MNNNKRVPNYMYRRDDKHKEMILMRNSFDVITELLYVGVSGFFYGMLIGVITGTTTGSIFDGTKADALAAGYGVGLVQTHIVLTVQAQRRYKEMIVDEKQLKEII